MAEGAIRIPEVTSPEQIITSYNLEQYLNPIKQWGINIEFRNYPPAIDRLGRERFSLIAGFDSRRKALIIDEAALRESPEMIKVAIFHEFFHIEAFRNLTYSNNPRLLGIERIREYIREEIEARRFASNLAKKINQSDFGQMEEADFLETLLAKAERPDELLDILSRHLKLDEKHILLLLYPETVGSFQTEPDRLLG
ncbi:MAG: hypothetical protein QHH09_02480 [Microgenomates group bacterium]|nr:hypothetical protein [Microgenomates group bacterium]